MRYSSGCVQLKQDRRSYTTYSLFFVHLNQGASQYAAFMPPIVLQFFTVFQAVGQIALVIIGAGWLARRGIIPKAGVKLLSDTVILVFLPCLIFSNIVTEFHPASSPGWWTLPLAAVLLILSGWALATPLLFRAGPAKRELMPMAFLQNAAFFVLPMGKVILDEGFEQFAVYISLYLIGNNPLLWLIGKHFLYKRGQGEPFRWSQLLSAPIYANLAALALVATDTRTFIPEILVNTTSFLGDATVPIATLSLGASLGSLNLNFRRYVKEGALVILQKLFLMPLVILGAMAFIPWLYSTPILLLFFILQGASPPASTLVLQSSSYSDNSERIGTIIVMCYIVCIISIPIWVTIAKSIYG